MCIYNERQHGSQTLFHTVIHVVRRKTNTTEGDNTVRRHCRPVLDNTRPACCSPANFKWPARDSLNLSNFCFKNNATGKTWLDTWKFQHKSNSGDALNLFQHSSLSTELWHRLW